MPRLWWAYVFEWTRRVERGRGHSTQSKDLAGVFAFVACDSALDRPVANGHCARQVEAANSLDPSFASFAFLPSHHDSPQHSTMEAQIEEVRYSVENCRN